MAQMKATACRKPWQRFQWSLHIVVGNNNRQGYEEQDRRMREEEMVRLAANREQPRRSYAMTAHSNLTEQNGLQMPGSCGGSPRRRVVPAGRVE
jgi:hypothetical protein